MILYQSPSISMYSSHLPQACTQYGLLVTIEGCPGLVSLQTQGNFRFEGQEVLQCGDAADLSFIQSQSDELTFVTCLNISGTYNVTALLSSSHFGSGLSCTGGDSTIVVPLSISPDLPEDCILDTAIEAGSSTDICD